MQPSLIPARPWKYNSAVTEYFVELEETSKIKRSDLDKYLHVSEKASFSQMLSSVQFEFYKLTKASIIHTRG